MNKAYKFSDFILDKRSIAVYHKNIQIQISSRAFEILSFLIERRGEVVEKDEILERVWKDSFVEEANLPVHISAIRRVLQERKGESRYIRTISGRGYSFVANVEEVNSHPVSDNFPKKKYAPVNELISIAVLPFIFESNTDENEYLANGVTQSLINDLSQIQNLRVLAYSAVKSYKNSKLELQEIGFLLEADKILTGTISEYKGKLEIVAELINAGDKRCLWGTTQSFEADDIFQVKKEISNTIAEKLKLKLGSASQQKEIDSEAQKLYYRGKFILESRGTRKKPEESLHQALKFFKEAIRREPNYALAHTGIGSVYVSLHNHSLLKNETAYAEAMTALQMAINTDFGLSEAFVLKGSIEIMFDMNFADADISLDKAIKINANNPDAYHWKSIICLALGKFKDALLFEEKAVKLDPTSSRFNESLTRIFYFSGNYNKAIIQAEEFLEFDSQMLASSIYLALSYAQIGFLDLALKYIDNAIKIRKSPEMLLQKATIFALFEDQEAALEILNSVLADYSKDEIDFADVGLVYATLNEIDFSVKYLIEAFNENSVGLLYLKIDSRFDSLRKDQRFNLLLEKSHLK